LRYAIACSEYSKIIEPDPVKRIGPFCLPASLEWQFFASFPIPANYDKMFLDILHLFFL